jgi:hypothetical protein
MPMDNFASITAQRPGETDITHLGPDRATAKELRQVRHVSVQTCTPAVTAGDFDAHWPLVVGGTKGEWLW